MEKGSKSHMQFGVFFDVFKYISMHIYAFQEYFFDLLKNFSYHVAVWNIAKYNVWFGFISKIRSHFTMKISELQYIIMSSNLWCNKNSIRHCHLLDGMAFFFVNTKAYRKSTMC